MTEYLIFVFVAFVASVIALLAFRPFPRLAVVLLAAISLIPIVNIIFAIIVFCFAIIEWAAILFKYISTLRITDRVMDWLCQPALKRWRGAK